jgi:thiamine monophosphate synthase
VAIGGIQRARIFEVIAAGADGVAFVSAMQSLERPESSVSAMADAVASAIGAREARAKDREVH